MRLDEECLAGEGPACWQVVFRLLCRLLEGVEFRSEVSREVGEDDVIEPGVDVGANNPRRLRSHASLLWGRRVDVDYQGCGGVSNCGCLLVVPHPQVPRAASVPRCGQAGKMGRASV